MAMLFFQDSIIERRSLIRGVQRFKNWEGAYPELGIHVKFEKTDLILFNSNSAIGSPVPLGEQFFDFSGLNQVGETIIKYFFMTHFSFLMRWSRFVGSL